MKLLACKECSDIFSLNFELKVCGCGESQGKYIDNLNAEVSGDCQLIGFDNNSLKMALGMQELEDMNQEPLEKGACCPQGVKFEAFFIPEVARSFKRVKIKSPNNQ